MPVTFRRSLAAVSALIVGSGLLVWLLWILFPVPRPRPYSLKIEDRQGRFVHAFRAVDGVWRLKTSPDEIPARLKRILLEKEDRWFYYHPGVNPFSLVRAAMQNISTGERVSGASTITMQLARMLEPKERTIPNKMLEAVRALQLEWIYSKDELLEMYLSMIPLGGNIEGLASASLLYYQTPLERLNIAQLLDLILIPNNPNALRPDRGGDRLLAERRRRASRWIAEGLLTRDDSVTIWSIPASTIRALPPRYAPHFALRVLRQSPDGANVRSTLDLDVQRGVETLLSNHQRPWKQLGVQNGAVVVIDNATGAIRAYAGSEAFGDYEAHGQVDAVMASRSPGSTLKPFLYALQIERGELTPRTALLDTPYDAEGFYAENYDGGYDGMVYADEALQRSLNVPMVRMLKQAGLPDFLQLLDRQGFASLQTQRDRLGLSMILGGCGVRLDELANAFAAFPRGGLWMPLAFLEKETGDTAETRRVFSQATAYLVTHMLSGIERPDLPNNIDYALHLPQVAYKTGTSYGRRDAWCVGYSAEYTVGVWIGNVTNRGNPELVGSRSAAPLLLDIFTSISTPSQTAILPVPSGVRTRKVCARSGRPPGPFCGRLIDDLYADHQSRTASCDICTEFLVSPDGSTTYCASCLGDHPYQTKVFAQYPAELLHFWKTRGVSQAIAPRHNPACPRVFAGEGPAILSPADGMTYYLVSRDQQFLLQAGSSVDVRVHRWYVDDRYMGTKQPGEKLFLALAEGRHAITCLDDRGRLSTVTIEVRNAL
ncbi:MAG TPA: penicillin-binding protein 1C [Bacteroidota bacterium]|nr:penicillin-binding protein 1C [Bacteroidota bacterium]